jgi:sialate O-acetylesterase
MTAALLCNILLLQASLVGASAFPSVESRLFTPTTRSAVAFSLSSTLGDFMVLQRAPQSAVVWGFAAPGSTVKTTFLGQPYSATTGADSIWRQSLPPQPATTTPMTITFSVSTGEAGALNDVLFGDVYICGGQSNMDCVC